MPTLSLAVTCPTRPLRGKLFQVIADIPFTPTNELKVPETIFPSLATKDSIPLFILLKRHIPDFGATLRHRHTGRHHGSDLA